MKLNFFHKYSWVIILTLILAIVAVVIFLKIKAKPNPLAVNENLASQFSESKDPEIKLLTAAIQSVGIEQPINSNMSSAWIDTNNTGLTLIGYSITIDQLDNEKTVRELDTRLANFFLAQGFRNNPSNTWETVDFGGFSTNLGFERDSIKCSVFLLAQSSPAGELFCGQIDQAQKILRDEFMAAINPKNDLVIIKVDKVDGNFATGNWHNLKAPEGMSWLAVKENGAWKKVYEGQEWPTCNLVDQYHMPRAIYENCYTDPSGRLRYELKNK